MSPSTCPSTLTDWAVIMPLTTARGCTCTWPRDSTSPSITPNTSRSDVLTTCPSISMPSPIVVRVGAVVRTEGAGTAVRSIAAAVGGTVTPLRSDGGSGVFAVGAAAGDDAGTVTDDVAGAAEAPGAVGNPGLGSLALGVTS